jgi:prepilin-type N-terminal cleavage/methylation domain-containing protein/prepilin-type processing-associated H-X9-DG protein
MLGVGSRTGLPSRRAFTLIEVLVVVALIALLVAILLPSLARGKQVAIQSACMSGLRQIGAAIHAYAADSRGCIPYGPKSPPPSATNFYPLTGNVTSLISLESGAPVGLGLLLSRHLGREKGVLFCPGADQLTDTQAALAAVGFSQVEASFYYRHASVAALSGPLPTPRIKIDQLGPNRTGFPIRCLAADTQFLAPPMLAMFNVNTRTHHQQRLVNALYVDGHVSQHKNLNDRYKIDVAVSVYDTLNRILSVLESLDHD